MKQLKKWLQAVWYCRRNAKNYLIEKNDNIQLTAELEQLRSDLHTLVTDPNSINAFVIKARIRLRLQLESACMFGTADAMSDDERGKGIIDQVKDQAYYNGFLTKDVIERWRNDVLNKPHVDALGEDHTTIAPPDTATGVWTHFNDIIGTIQKAKADFQIMRNRLPDYFEMSKKTWDTICELIPATDHPDVKFTHFEGIPVKINDDLDYGVVNFPNKSRIEDKADMDWQKLKYPYYIPPTGKIHDLGSFAMEMSKAMPTIREACHAAINYSNMLKKKEEILMAALNKKLDDQIEEALLLTKRVDAIYMSKETWRSLSGISAVECAGRETHAWHKNIPIIFVDHVPYGEFNLDFKCF